MNNQVPNTVSVMKKVKRIFWSIVILSIIGIIAFLNLEVIQKKLFDVKADAVGSKRMVVFYSFTGDAITSYTDSSVRFEALPTGGVSVWLGDANKKVHSNMQYIIEDVR